MEASDNGYFGAGGIRTASIAIQVAVVAVNDAPVVVAPFGGKAVPGETTPFPGFLIMDPDTDTDGMLMAAMLKVIISRQRLMFATMHAVLRASRRVEQGVWAEANNIGCTAGIRQTASRRLKAHPTGRLCLHSDHAIQHEQLSTGPGCSA